MTPTIDEVLNKHCSGLCITPREAKAAMTEYASLNRQGWTRVEDGLPESGYDVLVSDGDANWVAYCENGLWDFLGAKHWKQENVTHWMKLPEPPK